MRIETFELERRQSVWENIVDYNLTESGFHPYTMSELLSESQIEQLKDIRIGYGQTNGSKELRTAISSLYPGANLENVSVTNGSAESNFLSVWSVLEPNDELLLMLPNYMQIWGIARSFGVNVKPFHLKEELQWQPDLDEIKSLVSEKTKMIAVCNPNNPTGSILTKKAMEEIVEIANEADAWILSDEVYRGAEISGLETPSFYGLYKKVIAVSGLSKAYSLPGLRMGWLVSTEKIAEKAWSYKDYTTIATGALNQQIATWVLSSNIRLQILERNRKMLKENLVILTDWLDNLKSLFRFIPPQAAAIVFLKYNFDMNSTKLTTKLRDEKSLLIIAGDCFGMDGYLRIGIGSEKEYLIEGLKLFQEGLEEILK
ncbi:MAG: aminotransferase class I/II-fold pyridoxal phosphate-dependent enzyme [Candidatus Heimdallarchaeota archaeon]|nr:aminotransferase class I/II-fold pyridoxal phosphate-dependent enzyme [Candidatus Heimdallarchaeota archaeon]MCK4770198.1 aminotransferase class I/II-fold pyridoxal phosphate-dependent enzyme [Candidatus Heimdallarchaeota archaeon]